MRLEKIAEGIGWFSIGLGMTQLAAPKRLGRMIGVGEHPVAMRAMGLREIAHGVGVLAPERPKMGLWSRVFGDALDLSLLGTAATKRKDNAGRIMAAAGAVVAVGVLDYLCAKYI